MTSILNDRAFGTRRRSWTTPDAYPNGLGHASIATKRYSPSAVTAACWSESGSPFSQRGRFGLIHLDGHTDFRHPGNSHECGSLGGEDLAAVVGRHWDSVADIDEHRPYFRTEDTAHLGSRSDDEHLEEVGDALAFVMPAEAIRSSGPPRVAAQVLAALPLDLLDGYWIHLDVDILDPSIMPAVDSPADNGLSAEDLLALLAPLVPGAVGLDITIYDPDLDPEGTYARLLTELVTEALSPFAHNDCARQ